MRSLTRREFLHGSAALAGAAMLGSSLPVASAKAKKADLNDQLQVAVVGAHGRGMDHVKEGFAAKHNCVIPPVGDVDEGVIGPAMTAVEKAQGKAPTFEKDLRKVL